MLGGILHIAEGAPHVCFTANAGGAHCGGIEKDLPQQGGQIYMDATQL